MQHLPALLLPTASPAVDALLIIAPEVGDTGQHGLYRTLAEGTEAFSLDTLADTEQEIDVVRLAFPAE